MNGNAKAIADNGYDGQLIDVECHLSNGLPGIIVVGYAGKATDEARERLRSAFHSSGLEMPRKRVTVNLAPADIRKEGTGLDLAIAAAILQAAGYLPKESLQKVLCFGELALDGRIRPIRGIIGKLLYARKLGYCDVYIPAGNSAQAALVPGINIYPVESLLALYGALTQSAPIPVQEQVRLETDSSNRQIVDFSDVIGQVRSKRALQIAAGGGHNVLLSGPPGTGKSMLAKAFVGILPPLSHSEILEVTHLHSLAGKPEEVVIKRPLRAPHHSASDTAILGGGSQPRPGEISLSHKGVLFLDELPQFRRSAIEALRQPLEDKYITITRVRNTVRFPADFILVATQNPCPCGYYGSSRNCECAARDIKNYQQRLSGPILDRIDLHVGVDEVPHELLLGAPEKTNESTTSIQKIIIASRLIQAERFKHNQKTNSLMTNRDIKLLAKLEPSAKKMLDLAASKLQLSARAYMRTIRVSRTIADLERAASISSANIAEALQYRRSPKIL